ncbi:o-hypothetical protein [Limosa lapponica baueri]|uniref:Uncharacterized protein n=1 Tax=Limosa lapponica baueri TaxID=1758121 RepID=A0A2I0U182_LIMLA|nr:o-hypothetical protein [Limosa lapponica baueri]
MMVLSRDNDSKSKCKIFFFNDHLKGTSNFHYEQGTVFLMVLFLNFRSCLSTGQIFRMFVHMIRARRILLIGKLKGYSILAIAEELPDDGKIFACAEAPYLGVNSQEAFDCSSDGKKISMRVGPLADTLEALHAEDEHFDIVFIDADQRNAVNYYSFVMDNHLLRMDGVICVENTLMKGQVYLENISDENVLAVRKLNTVINSDPRVQQIIVPVQSGLSIIQRSPAPPDAVIESKKEVLRDDVFWGYNRRRILDRLRLDGKVAYVTGGGQGIGRAFAHALGEAGAKVAVVDLVLAKAEAVVCELSLKVPHPQKQLAYNASKAGVVKLTQTLGTEWIDRGVKVNCISPKMTSQLAGEGDTGQGSSLPEKVFGCKKEVLEQPGEQISIGVNGMTVMYSELDLGMVLPQVIL